MRHRLVLTSLATATLVGVPLLAGSPAAQAGGPTSLAAPVGLTAATLGGTAPARTALADTALPGTAPLLLPGATVVGRAAGQARQRVVLVLALRNQAGLTALLAAQQVPGNPEYRRWLTPQEFTQRFGPTTGTVQLATSWARSADLAVDEVSTNNTLVTLSGTRAQLSKAFGVALRAVRLAGTSYVTPDRTAVLPAALRAASAAVLGLTTYNPARLSTQIRGAATPTVATSTVATSTVATSTVASTATPARTTSTPAGYQTYGFASYGPNDFNAIYHTPAATTGTGQTVAVITQGSLTGVRSDLAIFQARNHLPVVPLTVVETTATSTDISGAAEYDLDTQYSAGFAPGVSTLLAYNSDTLGDIHPLNRFVTDRRSLTASASYGGCETLNDLLGMIAADDQVFQQADAQGQSFWFASGDEGSSCSILVNTGTPAGVPNVSYPASSPYVVAVGGTSLTGQSAQPTREITWLGGGGGYSAAEAAPAWQTSSLTFQPAVGRGVPDVSLDADPSSGYIVVVAGVDTVIGGTSASAPAWNGIWARVLQRRPNVGFAAPVLYGARAGLVDITLGTNGLYPATAGYDLSTGLGSADITALVDTLR